MTDSKNCCDLCVYERDRKKATDRGCLCLSDSVSLCVCVSVFLFLSLSFCVCLKENKMFRIYNRKKELKGSEVSSRENRTKDTLLGVKEMRQQCMEDQMISKLSCLSALTKRASLTNICLFYVRPSVFCSLLTKDMVQNHVSNRSFQYSIYSIAQPF